VRVRLALKDPVLLGVPLREAVLEGVRVLEAVLLGVPDRVLLGERDAV
jgi:hypothetical protein